MKFTIRILEDKGTRMGLIMFTQVPKLLTYSHFNPSNLTLGSATLTFSVLLSHIYGPPV